MVQESDRENLESAENDMIVFVDEMNTTNELNYRKAKALEIIAYELIKLNENIVGLKDILHKSR